MPDSPEYLTRKREFRRLVTVYGRNAVMEALRDDSLTLHCLHLADSNRRAAVLDEMQALADRRGLEVRYHSRQALSRISRNARQDQGVALDVRCPDFRDLDEMLDVGHPLPRNLLALDGITNPQNLGMILRSAVAGHIDGVLWSRGGNASLGPLVIKASAGTLFRAPLLHCDSIEDALVRCRAAGYEVCSLRADATQSLYALTNDRPRVFVLGNETTGVSPAVESVADFGVAIPMRNGVESLNVAVTAALIAFAPGLAGDHLDR